MHACSTRGNPAAAKLVFGAGLIVLGMVFILHNLIPRPGTDYLFFGPLALLLLALTRFIRRGWLNFGGNLLLLGAIALQVRDLGHHDLLARWWPAGLVWLGLIKVLHSIRRSGNLDSCQDACGRTS